MVQLQVLKIKYMQISIINEKDTCVSVVMPVTHSLFGCILTICNVHKMLFKDQFTG